MCGEHDLGPGVGLLEMEDNAADVTGDHGWGGEQAQP